MIPTRLSVFSVIEYVGNSNPTLTGGWRLSSLTSNCTSGNSQIGLRDVTILLLDSDHFCRYGRENLEI